MILNNNYAPKPDPEPAGTAIPISSLRIGQKFRVRSLQGVYTIHSVDPVKIVRPDGWIVRCNDDKIIVYLIK